MLYPINPAHNQAKLTLYQRIMVPKVGKPFVFTRVPGSYCDLNKPYTCSGFPNTADPWSSHDITITSVVGGGSTFHRLMSWKDAEWHYVDEKK